MRFKFRTPKVAWLVLSFLTMLSAASIAGCSGPSETEVATAKQARAEAINTAEAEDPGINKRARKKGATAKSIKGRLGGGQTIPD